MDVIYWQVFALWNVIVMLVYGLDKLKAKRGSRRISEKTLLGLAFLLGALGALAGMQLFRHKTLKPKFKFGVPALFVLNGAVIVALVKYVFA